MLAAPEIRLAMIEDSPIIRERLLERLGQIGNLSVVAQAETEADAITLLDTINWNIAILDLQLRAGSGLGVLKQFPQDRRRENAKIIVFTNFGFPQYRQRCVALGADYFFDKSREFEAMHEVIVGLAGNTTSTRH